MKQKKGGRRKIRAKYARGKPGAREKKGKAKHVKKQEIKAVSDTTNNKLSSNEKGDDVQLQGEERGKVRKNKDRTGRGRERTPSKRAANRAWTRDDRSNGTS